MSVVVDSVLVLAGHRVVHKVETRLTRHLDGRLLSALLLLLLLLTIGVNLRGHGLLELVEVQALQLSSAGSSRDSGELLLELLLALSEEQASELELLHHIGVHLGLLSVEGGRGQDLLGHRIHVLLLLLLLLVLLLVLLVVMALRLLLLVLLLLLLTATVVVATKAGSSS